MSWPVIKNPKGTADNLDTVPEVQRGWREPIVGEMGILARGICGVHRKTFVKLLYYFSHFFFSKNLQKKFTTSTKFTEC